MPPEDLYQNDYRRIGSETEQINAHDPWELVITKVDNGYILAGTSGSEGLPCIQVIEEIDDDILCAPEDLLWRVMDYFAFQDDKQDGKQLYVVRKKSK